MRLPLHRIVVVGIVILLAMLLAAIWISPPDEKATGLGGTSTAAAAPYGRMTIESISTGQDLQGTIRDHSWQVVSPFDAGGGAGGGSGKATFEDFVVTRTISQSSPSIAGALAPGRHLPSVTIQIYKPGTTKVANSYTLEDAVITGLSESPGSAQTEVLTFAYQRITWTFNDVTFCWDVAANTAC